MKPRGAPVGINCPLATICSGALQKILIRPLSYLLLRDTLWRGPLLPSGYLTVRLGGEISVGFTVMPLPDGDVAYPRRRSGGGSPRSRSQIIPLSN